MRETQLLSVAISIVLLGCFDDPEPGGSGASTESSTGDGDGEAQPGDGDGEPAGDGDGEPATGDGDGEPAGDGDGEPATGDGDGEPEDLCGNGEIDAGEVCDDGPMNLGIEEGDCAPDCSTNVVTRTIVLSGLSNGNLENIDGEGDLPERVDSLCPFGYKALFTYGGARNASNRPFAGDGQVDWALRPWTRYEREDGTWIGTTDAGALLGVRGGAWYGLEAPISEVANGKVWTGMNPDFTTVADPDEVCDGFSNLFTDGWVGDAALSGLENGQNYIQSAKRSCSNAALGRVVCADQ